jgi:hypothetical protein
VSEPLTLAEAVPLGTVHLQQLLAAAGIRSLVIKGPAFVELGVRKPRQSNDIDLLVAPGDRTAATEALAEAGWSIISHWFPPALDDIVYSTTFRHERFPATLDLHHHFSGFLTKQDVFEAMWQERQSVQVAHLAALTTSNEHALIIEALNRIKYLDDCDRHSAAVRVVADANPFDLARVAAAAETLGARHSASPLTEALGGSTPSEPPPAGYRRWTVQASQNRGRDLFKEILLRAPQHLPRILWQQLALDPHMARLWADAHGVEYRSPRQVLRLRAKILLRGGRTTGR